MTESLFIGKNHITLKSVDSTNNFARQLLSESEPAEGTLISANEQHAGRGQMGNSWESEAGKNLTVSIILYPNFLEADKQFFLNMAITLGVKDFCEFALGDEIRIKWPNDIYYGDNKLGGILIENSIKGAALSSAIAGIGININQLEFNPALPNPTSFIRVKKPQSSEHYDIPALIDYLSSYIEKYYLQLRQLHFNFLDRAYTESLYRYQQTHQFKKGDTLFRGEINGVAKDGKLIIHSNGKELRFGFKEVEFII